ncbi:MAG: hypothetical protein D6791_05150, partial [Chloroflexi bacterium]
MATETAVGRLSRQDDIIQRPARSPLQDALRQLRKNRIAVAGGIFIIILILIATFTDTTVISLFTGGEVKPLLAPKHYATANFRAVDVGVWQTAGGEFYPLGADYLGRDILSRTLYG